MPFTPLNGLQSGFQPLDQTALYLASKERKAREAAEAEANWDPSQHPSMFGGGGPGMSYAEDQLNQQRYTSGGLPDPQWDAYSEAMTQAGEKANAEGKDFKVDWGGWGTPGATVDIPKTEFTPGAQFTVNPSGGYTKTYDTLQNDPNSPYYTGKIKPKTVPTAPVEGLKGAR